jgi:hypothetical protein
MPRGGRKGPKGLQGREGRKGRRQLEGSRGGAYGDPGRCPGVREGAPSALEDGLAMPAAAGGSGSRRRRDRARRRWLRARLRLRRASCDPGDGEASRACRGRAFPARGTSSGATAPAHHSIGQRSPSQGRSRRLARPVCPARGRSGRRRAEPTSRAAVEPARAQAVHARPRGAESGRPFKGLGVRPVARASALRRKRLRGLPGGRSSRPGRRGSR